jgi:hypothetical protein
MSLSATAQEEYNEMSSWISQNRLNYAGEDMYYLEKELKNYCHHHDDDPKPSPPPNSVVEKFIISPRQATKAHSLHNKLKKFWKQSEERDKRHEEYGYSEEDEYYHEEDIKPKPLTPKTAKVSWAKMASGTA